MRRGVRRRVFTGSRAAPCPALSWGGSLTCPGLFPHLHAQLSLCAHPGSTSHSGFTSLLPPGFGAVGVGGYLAGLDNFFLNFSKASES